MAFVATLSTKEARAVSLGPIKLVFLTYAAASGDTSGTVTVAPLTSLRHVIVDGLISQTTAVSFSGNVATLTFADPVATISGTILAFGV